MFCSLLSSLPFLLSAPSFLCYFLFSLSCAGPYLKDSNQQPQKNGKNTFITLFSNSLVCHCRAAFAFSFFLISLLSSSPPSSLSPFSFARPLLLAFFSHFHVFSSAAGTLPLECFQHYITQVCLRKLFACLFSSLLLLFSNYPRFHSPSLRLLTPSLGYSLLISFAGLYFSCSLRTRQRTAVLQSG